MTIFWLIKWFSLPENIDATTSGFLFGMSRKKELKECGHLASVASAEVISHYGARPLVKLSSLI